MNTNEALSMRGRAAARLMLPRSVGEYLLSPTLTLSKTLEWLNARWRLRRCTAVGRWSRLTGRPQINNQGEIVLGDRVRIHSHYARSVLTSLRGGRLEIGSGTFVNYGADIVATMLIRIGTNCLIGTHCIILDNDFHSIEDRYKAPKPRPVVIGDNVWIGNRVIVLPGSTIGDGAVIGAGSVVKGLIPPRAVAAGNPARVIRQVEAWG